MCGARHRPRHATAAQLHQTGTTFAHFSTRVFVGIRFRGIPLKLAFEPFYGSYWKTLNGLDSKDES